MFRVPPPWCRRSPRVEDFETKKKPLSEDKSLEDSK